MPAEFNARAFHARRKLFKIVGLVLVLAGVFTIIDLMSELPIPLTGYRAVFAGTVLIVFGLLALYSGYKLPLDEALNLIHQRGRGITESELVHEMRVDRVTAGRIITALVNKGFLRRGSEQGNVDEVFDAVR